MLLDTVRFMKNDDNVSELQILLQHSKRDGWYVEALKVISITGYRFVTYESKSRFSMWQAPLTLKRCTKALEAEVSKREDVRLAAALMKADFLRRHPNYTVDDFTTDADYTAYYAKRLSEALA